MPDVRNSVTNVASTTMKPIQAIHVFVLFLVLSTLVTPVVSTQVLVHWRDCLAQPTSWYGGSEAIRIADNLLLFQFPSGGWPKNIDMTEELSAAEKNALVAPTRVEDATIDNSATYTQLRFLARAYSSTKRERFKKSFQNGFDYLMKAQYENGGWPQFYPLHEGYYSHITFNDNAMAGVLSLLRDIVEGKAEFRFVDNVRKEEARRSIGKGIACILKCQVHVDGQRTAWCAQHDERTFEPAEARTYELRSLSGMESVGVVEFLMGIENPSKEVIQSVQSAVLWFHRARIGGIKTVLKDDSTAPSGKDRIVVRDSSAPPMWARFYQIGTNKPFYCSRDGVMRDSLSQISSERRNHYVWLGYWPEALLTKEYPRWIAKNRLVSVLQ